MGYDMKERHSFWLSKGSDGAYRVSYPVPRVLDCTPWESTGQKDHEAAALWAHNHGFMPSEEEIDRVLRELGQVLQVDTSESRQVLTVIEAGKLLSESRMEKVWHGDRLHYCLNLVAALTGLGLCELQALQRRHVDFADNTTVEVVYRWNRTQGLAEVECGRVVWIPQVAARWLARVMSASSNQTPKALVFQGDHEHRARHGLRAECGKVPIHHTWIGRKLREALRNIDVNPSERGIVFDGWRRLSLQERKLLSSHVSAPAS